jgi:transcriptional regulator with XRE-family HTH domain
LRVPRIPAQTLGERIRRFRLEQGLYQAQLAKLTGLHEMTIVSWEKDRTVPRGEHLGRLAEALGVESEEIG